MAEKVRSDASNIDEGDPSTFKYNTDCGFELAYKEGTQCSGCVFAEKDIKIGNSTISGSSKGFCAKFQQKPNEILNGTEKCKFRES